MKKIMSNSYKQATIDAKHQEILDTYGAKKIDEFVSGPYELYLMKDTHIGYQLGLQTDTTQFADVAQQQAKVPMHEKIGRAHV